jgi:hypothetical protein
MTELVVIFDRLLNKNTVGIVIGYLTDPPALPYLKELRRRTFGIYNDKDWCYEKYYVNSITEDKQRIKAKIRFYNRRGDWYAKTWV